MTQVVGAGDAGEADVGRDQDENDDVRIEGTPQSPLDVLRGNRKKLDATLYIDLAVPRWEEVIGNTIWIRYKAANPAVLYEARAKFEAHHLAKKKKDGRGDPDWEIRANAQMLVEACMGVYFLEPGEKPPDELPGDLPTFGDPELSISLDAPKSAIATVMKLYGTNGDVLLAANQLLLFSGETSQEASEAYLKA